ncbi:MAG: hypothetical protein KA436_10045 [Oligoflexales bacterium]|nr:hypothetical protein [Oligoflexales bacterium]
MCLHVLALCLLVSLTLSSPAKASSALLTPHKNSGEIAVRKSIELVTQVFQYAPIFPIPSQAKDYLRLKADASSPAAPRHDEVRILGQLKHSEGPRWHRINSMLK